MRWGRAAIVAAAAAVLALVPAAAASAHPLGNFTVNHHDGLVLTPDAVLLTVVVDRAEIPAAQALQEIAPDGPPAEDRLAEAAAAECAVLAREVRLTVDGAAVGWTVETTGMELPPGAANLPTMRLTCALRAEVDLSAPATVAFRDEYLSGPVGWREITVDGHGIRLLDSPVPVESPTDELRAYPEDLLASPLDVRSLEVATEPGENTAAGASAVAPSSSDPFGSAMAALDRRLQTMIGDGRLTPLVGALAVGLAVLLGCGHALLPGHGKTVMAAYLAGRRGHSRDAVLVGATVTATHTVGVLVLGLAVSLSSSFAGDQVLRWLGVVSGALVASIGALMLRGAVRNRRSDDAAVVEDVPLAVGVGALVSAGVNAGVGTRPHVRATDVRTRDHSHGHDHSHDHDHPHDHDHLHADNHDHVEGGVRAWWSGRHSHHPGGHTHAPHAHGHRSGHGGLVGMGIAGGLVPSPSALVVLLASIGLGRTVFGVFLVVAYGLGMATTLTAVGLALVHMRDRLSRRLNVTGSSNRLRRIARTGPLVTAVLVLTVGLALVVRGAVLGA